MTKHQLETIRDFLKEKRQGYISNREVYKLNASRAQDYDEPNALRAYLSLMNYNDIAASECGVMLADVMIQLSEVDKREEYEGA